MRRLITLIVLIAFLLAPMDVFAVTYASVGPTTNFIGDVGVPSGKAYYINGTLLALGDITTAELVTEAMLKAVNAPADEDIFTYESTTGDFEWHTPAELGLQGAITGTDTHVMFFDGANTPAGDAGLTYNKTTDALTAVTFVGALTGNATTCTTASAGDAALDFFGAGVTAVTDATACTDIEGTGLTITTGVLNVDDIYLLLAGDVATGVHDFGGATSFEIPNSATPTLTATGAIAYDTTVADMTNGCLAYYDGTTINYVISLAAADIWSTDDYVVAYDATNDKFYMKADADTGGFTGNFLDHFMDVDAADVDYIATLITADGDQYGEFVQHPDYGRNITVTGNNVSSAGTVTITGNLANGTTAQTEDIIVSGTSTVQGAKAFITVTGISVASIAEGFTIGIGDKIGLTNSIDGATDIYNKVVDGINAFDEISGKTDTTNNTLDCATIVQNEDITVYYHN